MDYPLENLDPEKFQQLCQSLLIKEFPQVQCFPVAQPDGGRDAISFVFDTGNEKFMVFQVKYVRKPQAETDPHKWLTAIVEDEAPKIKELIPKGAIRYVLLTNISGTAHPEKGSIDLVNSLLSTEIGIPSQCWWRDDINRRLDNAWDLKWMYTEIMTGPDFLRLIIESGLSEHKERRNASIKAFLRAQYEMDEEVRFKQVELQNKLLDLFVDVPISLRDQTDTKCSNTFFSIVGNTGAESAGAIHHEDVASQLVFVDPSVRWHHPFDASIGAATLILSRLMQQNMKHVVIEGAPGQGKSTIAQYICQVHRMRLLNEQESINKLPTHHAKAPIRLPIKVDLRDFAVWLGKKDPFNVEQEEVVPRHWNKSLESFLAALISNQSGGTDFSTDDLLAVFRISSVIIVLDGLDEVADMARRHEVVAEIVKGVQRLEENAASIQSIVTSRPAAFANSPGMPHGKFPHLQLLSLNRRIIMDYAERWLLARKMDHKHSTEFRKILREKLDQPHLRDLARNPMQLAILLSLVLTRGASLPDKRTALYDFYIDLFFSREAEKSAVVRDHRELLIDIHRYLAWLLHSQAERGNARPSVRQDLLQQIVGDYLLREGHDPALAKELFTGMVERVVALVSRVEGTFEFEVQPLQEYFAACHLYYTAPQSSPGKEQSGSKPDRFDAIARNFYWLNVTRFYAGCYSKGELPSLVERLQELIGASDFHLISQPRMLAATLLGDWVFTQNPRSVQQVVDLILSGDSLRYVLAPSENRRVRADAQNALVLPPRCGRDELVKKCFDMLPHLHGKDFTHQVLELLKANSELSSDVSFLWLMNMRSVDRDQRLTWLEYGIHLGVLTTVDINVLAQLLAELDLSEDVAALIILFRARRLDYLHSSCDIFEAIIPQILDRQIFAQAQSKVESPLDALNNSLDSGRFALAFRDRQPLPLAQFLEARGRSPKLTWSSHVSTETEFFPSHRMCMEIANIVETESQKSSALWATDLTPWSTVIEAARSLWGNRWAIVNLATVAAGIRSTAEKCADCPDLFDDNKPLARRFRYARLRSGAYRWWGTQLLASKSSNRLFVLLPLLTWGTNSTLLNNAALVDSMLEDLASQDWGRLFVAVRRCSGITRQEEERNESLGNSQLPTTMGLRFAAVLSDRLKPDDSKIIYDHYIKNRDTDDTHILQYVLRDALDLDHFATERWSPDLELVRRCYSSGIVSEPLIFQRMHFQRESNAMPLTVAEEILSTPQKYPGFLITSAEERLRLKVASNVAPVAVVAETENWFHTA
jgi:hypothetical protein